MNKLYVPRYNEAELEVTAAAYFPAISDSKVVYAAYVRTQPLIVGIGLTRQQALDNCMQSWCGRFTIQRRIQMSKWDKDLRVGDIITAYVKGFWRITDIRRRFVTEDYFAHTSYEEIEPGVYRHRYNHDVLRLGDEYSSLITMERVATQDFKPKTSAKLETCDAAYCTALTIPEIDRLHNQYTTGINALELLLPEWRKEL